MKKRSTGTELAKLLNVSASRGIEAVMKADLIQAIQKAVTRKKITHVELAKRSGLSRSAVTGILSGSLQKVTIDRVLRLVEAAGLDIKLKVNEAA
jgi:predicted XRE-type DNA-binding protein